VRPHGTIFILICHLAEVLPVDWQATNPGNQSRQPHMQACARTRVARFVMPVNLKSAYPAQKAQHIPALLPASFPSNNKARRAINTAGHKKEPPALGPGAELREESAVLAPRAG